MVFTTINEALSRDQESQTDSSLMLQVFDRIALPTFVIDKNHIILHWNCALEALTGLSREEMVGTSNQWKPFYQSPRPCLADLIIDGGHDADVQHYYQDKYRTSELIPDAYEAEDFFPECGESGEWLHFTAASLKDDNGTVIGAIETLDNISPRKKAEFELIERERKYRELSITDALTGLNNSRRFYEQLELSIEASRRYGHTFSLCFLDLDDFKHVNDTYGHMAGDLVLETLGTLIKASLRSSDSAYRYGGEEFAILLPLTDHEGATKFSDRIRESLRNCDIPASADTLVNVTTCVGITQYKVGDDTRLLLGRADNALYEAKRLGKDCTRVEL
ncbi:sensor domain-containing diguanylate cyclase [Pontibacterium granulatum]|uniref:sensor domain-containing diguanylate cyclase n=1 Tax=Pontibacterium granulatum TaxID=2036029 RepID=UPI00249C36C7|nr:sensor domain-containing diguanylate cyclase [Pontibacterium granulatum]MDI3324493.1 sensor domain-containing diguanylate cyclase [Pontibacterium granulatum]